MSTPGTPRPALRRTKGETGVLVRVWDPFVRVSHWTMAGGFVVAYVSEDALALHLWVGYAVGVIVALRVVWGFIGPRHARFTDFIYPPREVIAYLADLARSRARRYLGHSPAGGVAIIVLLAGLAGTVWSGHVAYIPQIDGESAVGARYVMTFAGAPVALRSVAERDDDDEWEGNERDDGAGELWEEVHEALAELMVVLVLVHIGGVLLASVVHRENLVRAMITGVKRKEP
jgi:cytochrome b